MTTNFVAIPFKRMPVSQPFRYMGRWYLKSYKNTNCAYVLNKYKEVVDAVKDQNIISCTIVPFTDTEVLVGTKKTSVLDVYKGAQISLDF